VVSFDASLDDERGTVDHTFPADCLKARPALLDRLRGDGLDLETREARLGQGPRLPRAGGRCLEAQAEAEGDQGGRRGISHERFTPAAS
jgi:hypothetical protein